MSWLGVPDDAPRPWSWPWWPLVGVVLTACGMALCVSLVFLSMREIMELGGFVARGGPYVVARPAPESVWLLPVAVVAGMILGFAEYELAYRAGGFALALPAWCALFLALGWNFAEYGAAPAGGGGPVWAWIVCAVAFVILGLAPVLLWSGVQWTVVERVRTQLALRREQRSRVSRGAPDGTPSPAYRRAYLGLNIAAVLAGGGLGVLVFRALPG